MKLMFIAARFHDKLWHCLHLTFGTLTCMNGTADSCSQSGSALLGLHALCGSQPRENFGAWKDVNAGYVK